MNFACRTISLLAIAVISLFPMASHAEDSPVPDTSKIAPDVLRQMDADLVSGKRPVIATIKQDSIYALRENPRLKADLIRFDFNLGELTTAQIRILDTWIRAGNNKIYLLDGDIPKYATLFGLTGGGPDILSGDSAKARQVYDSWKLEDHPVSTDCGRLSFGIFKSRDNDNRSPWFVGQYYLRGLDSQNATLLVSRKADVLCGSFTLGRGTVYFRNSVGGPDMWRWYLNFMHFVMDKRIPGAAESGTTVAGGSAAAGIDSDDKITLKNGDKLQGTILNETLTKRTFWFLFNDVL